MKFRLLAVFFSSLVLFGCCHSQPVTAEKMLELGSALTKLSTAVESTVRYKNPPSGSSDFELLAMATQHDPDLLKPFMEYKLLVLSQDKHAVVLVCTKDGKAGLLEDAGCSARLDSHLWEEKPVRPCEFTLKVQEVCKRQMPAGTQ